MNDAVQSPRPSPDTASLDRARAIHQVIVTLDTHIDIPWPTGPDPFLDGTRRVDLPKMQRGLLSAGCFVAYLPQTARSVAAEDAAYTRAIAMLEQIGGMQQSVAPIQVRVASTADAIEAAKHEGRLAVVPCVENGFAVGADLTRIAEFRKRAACIRRLAATADVNWTYIASVRAVASNTSSAVSGSIAASAEPITPIIARLGSW